MSVLCRFCFCLRRFSQSIREFVVVDGGGGGGGHSETIGEDAGCVRSAYGLRSQYRDLSPGGGGHSTFNWSGVCRWGVENRTLS